MWPFHRPLSMACKLEHHPEKPWDICLLSKILLHTRALPLGYTLTLRSSKPEPKSALLPEFSLIKLYMFHDALIYFPNPFDSICGCFVTKAKQKAYEFGKCKWPWSVVGIVPTSIGKWIASVGSADSFPVFPWFPWCLWLTFHRLKITARNLSRPFISHHSCF